MIRSDLALKRRNMKNTRIIPKVSWCNFRKLYPRKLDHVFKQWFYCERMWGGKIINIGVRHYQLTLDFRKNWLLDMIPKPKDE
jgi:hypothetical protein